jgi:archaea-specific DNA-binding protein
MGSDNSIFIGEKPFMNYVTSVVMQFTNYGVDDVIIKARGKFISRAVDIAEVCTKRFLKGKVEVKSIRIDSEEFQNKEGKDIRVSIIEVTITKVAGAGPIQFEPRPRQHAPMPPVEPEPDDGLL